MTKGDCPECGKPMEARPNKITRKRSAPQEIQGTVYVCTNCKGIFIPESVFGVR